MKRLVPLIIFLSMPVWTEPEFVTIDQAVSIAIKSHPELKSYEYESASAIAEYYSAKTLFYPTLTVASGYTHYGDPATITFANQKIQVGAEDEFTLQGQIDQTVYSGGRIRSQIDQARIKTDISKLQIKAERNQVIFDVRSACYEVMRQIALHKSALNSLQASESHKKDAEARVRAGLSAGIEVIRADVRVKEASLEVVTRKNALESAMTRLALLLNMPSSSRLEVRDEFPEKSIQKELDNPEKAALRYRPDIIILRAVAVAEEAGIKIASSGYLPNVSAFGNWYFKDDDLNAGDEGWKIGVSASWEIFNWGRTAAKVRSAQNKTLSAREKIITKEREIKKDVRDAELAISSAQEAIKLAEARREAAKEDLRISKLRFQEGVATGTEVIDAETSLASADAQYINAKADLSSALNRFWLVTGGDK